MNQEIIDFIIEAKRKTYADNISDCKVDSTRIGSKDYEYSKENMTYHDTYFGGVRFMGQEVIYINSNISLWGMTYYGITIDESLTEEAVDKALRPALMHVGEDDSVIPVRGPRKFVNGDFTYEFKTNGNMEDFSGVEEIFKGDKLAYRLYCNGGIIK